MWKLGLTACFVHASWGYETIRGCPSVLKFDWCETADEDCVHKYLFSVSQFMMKVESFVISNGRPPLKEAYFINKLPAYETESVRLACEPVLTASRMIVAESELFMNGLPLLESPWYIETINSIHQLSSAEQSLWHIPGLLSRVSVAAAALPSSSGDRLACVVCHCREDLSWLTNLTSVPSGASLHLYEKCGWDSSDFLASLSPVFSGGIFVTHQPDGPVRGDECTGYLSFITDHYDSLPDYSVFLQSDPDHHLYFPYLNSVLQAVSVGSYSVPFLHLNFHRHYQTTTPCMRDVEAFIFNLSTTVPPVPLIGTYCCAQFVVSGDRIRAHPVGFYRRALSMVDGSMADICSPVPPRRSSHCYVLEFLWHVVFGEPRFLPFRPDDVRLPISLRTKYGNERAKTRWNDVDLSSGQGGIISRNIEL